ncbi:MAG: OmpA family protein [Bacteroidales bacterium]|jgi:chemotaxis protein MotB|nr:OmpA family protein [Bacteroidales bacterium]MBR6175114.1 OmpA family protein [Bacteroidales bacterium]MBR6905155.1 OmpA family protein [Bacteroidales bacterium]
MKNTIRIAAVLLAVVVFGGCVTKQQYAELELKYKRSQDELTYMTAENQNCQDAKKSLAAQLAALTAEAEKLTADTVRLYRKARTCEMEYEKAQKEYDELLRNFAEVSSSNQSTIDGLLGDRDRYKDELALKEKMLNMQQDSLAKARTELMLKEQRINEMQSILAQKDAEVKALKEKVMNALKGFEGSGLNVYEKGGKVYVSMDDKLLFASGSWTLNEQGLNAIKQLAKVLENEKEISVLIEGHTDNVPYRGSGQIKDNWDLSVMRATAVVKALLENGDIEPVRLSASGRSEYLPLDENNTPEARAKNRRTEIILTPNLDELFQLIQGN